MAKEKKKRGVLLEQLKSKYRLVIMDDATFEEYASFRLSRIKIYILLGSVLLILTFIITSLIAFTPIREYIPGYADVTLRRDATLLKLKADSLERIIFTRDQYLNGIVNVLKGKVDTGSVKLAEEDIFYDTSKIGKISALDSQLRAEMENEINYNLYFPLTANVEGDAISDFHFFLPLKGFITSDFNADQNHFGIDIVAPENEPIIATLDGTVVLASWTLETGYIIALQHKDDLMSFYKHNSILLKKVNDYIKAGDVIAIIGSSGELTTGPHLHFELWHQGHPINPKEYIIF